MKKHYIKTAKSSSKFFAFLLLAGLAGIGTAKAQFVGAYKPAHWSLQVDSTIGGDIDLSGVPDSITLTSGNNNVQGFTYYQMVMPVSGNVSFDWSYTTNDGAEYDYPEYAINGNVFRFSTYDGYDGGGSNQQSGTVSNIAVNAGDTFKFVMYTTDGGVWPGVTTFKNFSAPLDPLAITLENISATAASGKNIITWNTAKEDHGDYFELERSANGKDFARIATINANEKPSEYKFTDAAPLSGMNYYRLKLEDAAGKAQYSKVVTALNQANEQQNIAIKAFPNPAADYVTVSVNDAKAGQIYVIDVAGKTVQSAPVATASTTLNTANLPAGVYTITYKAGENIASTQLVKK